MHVSTRTYAYIRTDDAHASDSDSDSDTAQGYHPGRTSHSRGSNRDSRDHHIRGNIYQEYGHMSPSREFHSAARPKKEHLFPAKIFARNRASPSRRYHLEESEGDAYSQDGGSYFGDEYTGVLVTQEGDYGGVYGRGRYHAYGHAYLTGKEIEKGYVDVNFDDNELEREYMDVYGGYGDAYAHRDLRDEREWGYGKDRERGDLYMHAYRGLCEGNGDRRDEDVMGSEFEEEYEYLCKDQGLDERKNLQLRALKHIRRYVNVVM